MNAYSINHCVSTVHQKRGGDSEMLHWSDYNQILFKYQNNLNQRFNSDAFN